MLAFIIVFGSAALYFINDAKNEAVAAKLEEEKRRTRQSPRTRCNRGKREESQIEGGNGAFERKRRKRKPGVEQLPSPPKRRRKGDCGREGTFGGEKSQGAAQEGKVAVAAQMEEEKARLRRKRQKKKLCSPNSRQRNRGPG